MALYNIIQHHNITVNKLLTKNSLPPRNDATSTVLVLAKVFCFNNRKGWKSFLFYFFFFLWFLQAGMLLKTLKAEDSEWGQRWLELVLIDLFYLDVKQVLSD